MKKTLGIAQYTASTKIQVLEPAEQYIFSLDDGFSSTVKKKDEVVLGDIIASSKQKHFYSPCNGVVETASEKEIVITPKDDITKDPIQPYIFENLEPKDYIELLQSFGLFSLWKNPHSLQVCIINALPTDATSVYNVPFLFAEEKHVLEKGIEVLTTLYPSAIIKLVIPKQTQYALQKTEAVPYAKQYPYTMDLIVKEHLEGPDALGVMMLSLLDIWHIGTVAIEKMPLTKTILTVNDAVLKLSFGYPIQNVFQKCKLSVDAIDGAVINGVMSGKALCTLHGGILPSMSSLHTFSASAIPPVLEDPCVNCGYCSQVCPVGLRVHLLNQYAEKTMFEACEEEHIETCIECGMCDYVCITKRPIMQYIRNAKEHTKTLLPMG